MISSVGLTGLRGLIYQGKCDIFIGYISSASGCLKKF